MTKQKPNKKPKWELVRQVGRDMHKYIFDELICPHGIGHHKGVHGCHEGDDGYPCCQSAPKELIEGLEPALTNDIAEIVLEVFSSLQKEVKGKIRKTKSTCTTYHNDFINTPDKIKMFNFGLKTAEEVVLQILNKYKI